MERRSVLVVDDLPLNLKLVRALLAKENLDLRTAESADKVFEVLTHFRPNLILMDIQLPGIDGLQLTRLLRLDPSTRDCVVVALTSYAMVGDKEKAIQAGCDGYIEKPINTRTFPSMIREYLNSEPQRKKAGPGLPVLDPELLIDLQASFLSDARDEAGKLLNMPLNDPATRQAFEIATHRWAGSAGTLGLGDLGSSAKALENKLRTSQVPLHCCMGELLALQTEMGSLRARDDD